MGGKGEGRRGEERREKEKGGWMDLSFDGEP